MKAQKRIALIASACIAVLAAVLFARHAITGPEPDAPTKYPAAWTLADGLEQAQAAYKPGNEREYYEAVERSAWLCSLHYYRYSESSDYGASGSITLTSGEEWSVDNDTLTSSWYLWDATFFELLSKEGAQDRPGDHAGIVFGVSNAGLFGLTTEQADLTAAFIAWAMRNGWVGERGERADLFEPFVDNAVKWRDGRLCSVLADNWPPWSEDTRAMVASHLADRFTTPSPGTARLVTLMAQDADPRPRRFAARIAPRMVGDLPDMDPVFRRLLEDPDPVARKAAFAAALGTRPSDALAPAMGDHVETSHDPAEERDFIAWLSYADDAKVAEKYASGALDSTDALLKGAAAVALFAHGRQECREAAFQYAHTGLLEPDLQRMVHECDFPYLRKKPAAPAATKNEPRMLRFKLIEPDAISPRKVNKLVKKLRHMRYVDPALTPQGSGLSDAGTRDLREIDWEIIQACQIELRKLGVNIYATPRSLENKT